MARFWSPTCERPDVVLPVRIDPEGRAGPTRGAAPGPYWTQSSRGLYVPHDAPRTVEQRILEQSCRLPEGIGAVTAWASLRWQRAAYFEGTTGWPARDLPVPLLLGGAGSNLRPDRRCALSKAQLPPEERIVVAGVPCTTLTRALFDEIVRLGNLRKAVVAADMTVAAGLTSTAEFTDYLERRYAWTGVPLAREVAALMIDDSRSPQETRMRLVWELDAELPRPLCNQPVFDLDGNLLGLPDLLDVEAGVVGEYDGADHLEKDRRSSDRTREEALRDAGLEYFAVVRGELSSRDKVADRMVAARRRAAWAAPDRRRWTLEWPDWYRASKPR